MANTKKQNSIQSILHELSSKKRKTLIQNYCFNGLKKEDTTFYRGKVRDCLITRDNYLMIHSDRLSAFDRIVSYVPFKGIYLTAINNFWLEKARTLVPVCPFKKINQRTIQMEKLTPLKIEVIVRAYLAGSMKRAYEAGKREFNSHILEDGIPSFGKLKRPIITPTTKAEIFSHDENIAPQEIISNNLCTSEQWSTICKTALKLFNLGSKIYAKKGWILVDTKYEFGFNKQGQIFVIDEIHTPDSSRLWLKTSYTHNIQSKQPPAMFDKEIIRDYLIQQNFMGKGSIPQIPSEKIIALSQAYLNVTEALLESTLRYETPQQNYDELIAKSL